MAASGVTIAVVPRERFSYARASLESILAQTARPFELIYVDGGSPPEVCDYLRRESIQRGFHHLRTEYFLFPNEARNLAVLHVRTPYVVFIDNDVLVTPGWLDALVRCADETGAWVVGPLYCIGQPSHHRIHMAGGDAHFREENGRRYLYEKHRFVNQFLPDVRPQLRRQSCETVEFHCLLARRDAFERLGPLDETLTGTREHLDFCLAVREAGGSVYFEPDSVVTYVPGPPFAPSDIPYYLFRWSEAATGACLRRFLQKWNISEDPTRAPLKLRWLQPHRQMVFGPWPRRFRYYLGEPFGDRIVGAADRFLVRMIQARQQRLRQRDGRSLPAFDAPNSS
jgi:GT2 family glycosyltransferase